jgi:hypothetical protein
MIGLVNNSSQRATKKSEIITEIKRLRKIREEEIATEAERQRQATEKQQKTQSLQSLITQAQTVLDKTTATKEEVEKAIKDLKTLSTATSDSPEAQV